MPAIFTRKLAEIVVTDIDLPWLTGRLQAGPEFEELRPLFVEELATLDVDVDERWEAACNRIREEMALTVT